MDIYNFTKPQLGSKLVNELKGVQRVPALLLPYPMESLKTVNIQK